MKKLFTILFTFFIVSAVSAQAILPGSARAKQLNETYCSGLFSTPDGVYFDLESDEAIGATSYFNVLDWLEGRVAGLQIYQYYNLRLPIIRNQLAAVYLDEMRIDYNTLNMIPVADIAMIKVIKTPFVGNWGASGGAIAIYTKGGEEDPDEGE
jgi:hypothetical protein